jgi:hypothetical protein
VIQVGAAIVSGVPVIFFRSAVGTMPISTSYVSPWLPTTTVESPEIA